jgi:hypothetical protein
MRVKKFPTGYFDFSDGILTICGQDILTIDVRDIRSVVCREGRKIIVSRSPYGIFECFYECNGNRITCRQLFQPCDMSAMQAMCEQINASRIETAVL